MQYRWKHIRWILVLNCLLIGMLGACSTPPTPAGETTTQEPATGSGSAEPITIGATLALTGPFGETGQWVERAYRYWAEEINEQGGLLGRPVELIIHDDGGSADQAVTLLERLITVDQVDLLLGGYPTTSVAAQMPLAEQHQMVYVGMGGNMLSFEQGYSYSFGAPPIIGEWWYNGVWEWLATLPEDERPKTAAVISMNNPIGGAVLEGIVQGLEKVGIELVMQEAYDLPLADATPLVVEAKASEADLFISNSTFGEGVQIVQAMKALDYNPDMFLQSIGPIVPAWVTELGADGDYVITGTPMSEKLPFAGLDRVGAAARERFAVPSTPLYFLFGYAWAEALQQGIEGVGALDQTAIRDYLRTQGVDGIAGQLTFDERGLPAPFNYVTQIINGEVELIWPEAVRTAAPVYPKPAWE